MALLSKSSNVHKQCVTTIKNVRNNDRHWHKHEWNPNKNTSLRFFKSESEKGRDLSSEIFENAILADAMFEAELLPELHPDLVPTLSHLERDDLPRHFPSLSRLGPREEDVSKWEQEEEIW